MRLLVEAGVDSIIDLTTPRDGLAPYRDALMLAAKEAGRQVRHFAHPIPDMSVIDHDGYDEILARIRDEISAGRVVYVHCWGGKGRTSTVVGCLLIDDGLDYEAALARIARVASRDPKGRRGLPGIAGPASVASRARRPASADVSHVTGNITTCRYTPCRSRCRQSCGIRACRATAEYPDVAGIPNSARWVRSAHSADTSDAAKNESRAG